MAEPADYSERGAFAVGVGGLLVEQNQPMEVFYPAAPEDVPADATPYRYTVQDVWGELAGLFEPGVIDDVVVADTWRELPPAAGPFPLVVISHGLAGSRFDYSMHAAHLASWGYMVAVPQHPVRDLAAFVTAADTSPADDATVLAAVAVLESENRREGSPFAGRISDQVAVIGHSAGGRDAALAAYDDAVDAWIGLAPTPPLRDEVMKGHKIYEEAPRGFDASAGEFDLDTFLQSAQPPAAPSMMLIGDSDIVYPVEERQRIYDWLPSPKMFVVLADTGHYVFADQCIEFERAGTVPHADALGLGPTSDVRQRLENGCLGADDAPVEDVWEVWYHLTVAYLNVVFDSDSDRAAASLDTEYVDERFGERIAAYTYDNETNAPG